MRERIFLEEALELICAKVSPVEETEYLPLFRAAGMILAEDIQARQDQPPFDRSPLDGYAVRSCDLEGASVQSPAKLTVIEEVHAGMWPQKRVERGQALRIMTGAPIPEGADCVVKQEDTEPVEGEILVYQSQRHHDNICFKGEDYQKNQQLMKKGEKLDAVKLGILSGNGLGSVTVFRRPKIAVVTTGDEICCRGETLTRGKIYDSNCQMLSGRVMELQCEPYGSEVFGDDTEAVSEYIHKIIKHVDAVITVGALSVGVKDIMHDVIRQLGAEQIFKRVKLKPGSPVSLSILGGKPILSLSGNPFAALATFELLARPLMARLRQDESLIMEKSRAVMASAFEKSSKVRRFLRAYEEDGKIYLKRSNSPGILSSMAGCNCIVDIPAGNKGLKPGEEVAIWLL